MRILTLILACLFALPAFAADSPSPTPPTAPAAPTVVAPIVATPTVAIPAPADHKGRFQHGSRLTPADLAAVNTRVPLIKKQLEGLSVDQQRAAVPRRASR